jgi:hypothetical protein
LHTSRDRNLATAGGCPFHLPDWSLNVRPVGFFPVKGRLQKTRVSRVKMIYFKMWTGKQRQLAKGRWLSVWKR